MRANLRIVLFVTLLYGTVTGIYEFTLPLLLKEWHWSLPAIGGMFSLSGLIVVLARIYMGGLADRWGRKLVYGWAMACCGLGTAFGAYSPLMLWQMPQKILHDVAALTRETLHPIILYEAGREVFLDRIGKFRGVEYLFQAGGTMLVGGILFALGRHGWSAADVYMLVLWVGGTLLLLASLVWALGYREVYQPVEQRRATLRDLLSFDLHPNLLAIALSGVIFAFGLQLSHSYYMMLFYRERFGASAEAMSLIMVIHRFTIALPMLVVGNLRLQNLKLWYIVGLVAQGIVISVSAVVPGLWISAAIWLLHDLIGAGFWVPIQSTLIQQFSRDETRGLEVSKVLAWSGVGAILGPIAASYLALQSPKLPFFISGILVLLSALPLLKLRMHASAPAAAAPVG